MGLILDFIRATIIFQKIKIKNINNANFTYYGFLNGPIWIGLFSRF